MTEKQRQRCSSFPPIAAQKGLPDAPQKRGTACERLVHPDYKLGVLSLFQLPLFLGHNSKVKRRSKHNPQHKHHINPKPNHNHHINSNPKRNPKHKHTRLHQKKTKHRLNPVPLLPPGLYLFLAQLICSTRKRKSTRRTCPSTPFLLVEN